MPIHIDEPAPGMAFDPRRFAVRGWLWLEDRHARIVAVEAWNDQVKLGETSVLSVRADVTSKYALPDETRTAFAIDAAHPGVAAGRQFDLQIRARLDDGTRTPPLFASRVGPLPLERDPRAMLHARLPARALGVEIGAHTHPVEGLTPFYADAVADFAGTAGHVDFLADARALPIADGSLDYLCSSHVLEHLPDPLAALHEWHRVLSPGGWLYLVVPDRRFTFDHPRPATTAAHLLEDFAAARTASASLEHVDEFIYQTDWSLLHPDTPAAERPARQIAARNRYLHDIRHGLPIDIHFHTFTPDSLRDVLKAAGFIEGASPRFEIASEAERYPPDRTDGIALLLRRLPSAAARPAAANSFTLAVSDSRIPPLPLVCPVSLSPLRCDTNTSGPTELVSAEGRRYAFAASRPALLPAADAAPVRPWRSSVAAVSTPAPTPADSAQARIDEPVAGALVEPLAFFVRGWAWLDSHHSSLAALEVWEGETRIGETGVRYDRPDVRGALGLPDAARVGFELFAHLPGAGFTRPLELTLRARMADGSRTPPLAGTRVTVLGRDYRRNPLGFLLDSSATRLQRLEEVTADLAVPAADDGELTQLVRRYLGAAPRRVLGIGPEVSSLGPSLTADGHEWHAFAGDAGDAPKEGPLDARRRPRNAPALPWADGHFDAVLWLGGLDRVDAPEECLREASRVARRQLIVSVPNAELLGYLWDHRVAPWTSIDPRPQHLFTRWNLAALLCPFYPSVEVRFHGHFPLRTVEGTPLHSHLLAVATRPA